MATLHIDSLLIQSISLSLMHFLWQACVIAGVAAIGFAFLRQSPNRRYMWGVVCFAAFAVCPMGTYCWLQPISPVPTEMDLVGARATQIYPRQRIVEDFSAEAEFALAYPSDHWQIGHSLIVAIWLLGQMFVGSRLLASGYFVYRVKQAAAPVHDELRCIAERLAKKMHIRCPLVASAERMGGAIAAGFFRQIIVIPAAWLTDMTPDMLAAVIAHEMAHLRRHDLWINLVQRMVESTLFFHPAVWWLSKRIRQDREVCCDLLAIEATQQRKHYAETLEHVARLESVRAELLVTHMGDDRMSLLRRVRFVLGQQPHASSLGWWPAGVLAIVIPCGLVWLSQARSSFAEQPSVAPQAATQSDELAPAAVPAEFPHEEPIGRQQGEAAILHVAKANGRPAPPWKLGEYIIEPPDIVEIIVLGEKQHDNGENISVSGRHLVTADGMVDLGMYGRVYIAGLTVHNAMAAVREQLANSMKDPEVALSVAVINSKFFYIIVDGGETGDQIMRIPVTGNETVLDAIARIGGIGQRDVKLHLKRPVPMGGDVQILPIDWKATVRGASTATNYQLLPGDRLFISTAEPEQVGESSRPDQELVHRIPILGPITSGDKANVIDPPSDDEILRLIQASSPASVLALPEDRPHVTIKKQLIADYVDPPRFFSLVGRAQLHHAHYKCVIQLGRRAKNLKDANLPRTLFIDHQHLHVIDEVDVAEPTPLQFGSRTQTGL